MTKDSLDQHLQFHCKVATFWTDRVALRIEKEIKALPEVMPEDDGIISTLAMIYSCTEKIAFTFNGTERQPLTDFKARWETLNNGAEALWEMRKAMPTLLMSAWIDAFNAAQQLFDVPDEQKPLSWLTAAEQAEAKQANSPLAADADAGKSA